MDLYQSEMPSPLGLVYVVSDGTHLRAIDYDEARLERMLKRYYGSYTLHVDRQPHIAISRLTDYFAGDLNAVDDLTVATSGTDFQHEVWAALRTIPAGTTTSYGQLAAQIGRPKACRAVGLANGSNPINIIVPCHRVIGANDTLTGYGGGLERKKWLLEHEGAANLKRSPQLQLAIG